MKYVGRFVPISLLFAAIKLFILKLYKKTLFNLFVIFLLKFCSLKVFIEGYQWKLDLFEQINIFNIWIIHFSHKINNDYRKV